MSEAAPSLVMPGGEWIRLEARNLIGRAASCTVVLPGEEVSREHAHLYELNGEYFLADQRSANGTYLNEVRVNYPTRLKSGDTIRIVDHVLRFVASSMPLPVDEPTQPASIAARTQLAFQMAKAWLLVADIIGSTRLTHQLSPVDYARVVGDWFRNCSQIIESFGGAVNKATGDGLFAFWIDEEDAKGESVLRALSALQRVQRSGPLGFRLVVHYGNVGIGGAAAIGEETLSGQDVHYLFRIEQGLERSVTLAVSQAASRHLERLCPMTSIGTVQLKGFTDPAPVFQPQLEQVL
jgi:class 3 adenylate cyclase